MDNPIDDKKEMSIERDSSIDTVPDKQSTSTKSIFILKSVVVSLEWVSLNFRVFISTVDILLNATGNVPIMKKRKWAVEGNKPISSIMSFIHKYLKMDAEDKLVSFSTLIRLSINSLTNTYFSFCMWIKHLHQHRIKLLKIYMIVMDLMANWYCTIVKVKRGVNYRILFI